LMFDFTLNVISVGSTGKLTLYLDSTNFPATMPTSGTINCYIVTISSGAYTPCTITTGTSGSYKTFILVPLATLASNTPYRAYVTSMFADNGLEGVKWSTGGTRSAAALEAYDGATYERDLSFYELYATKFTSCIVRGYSNKPGGENVIDVTVGISGSVGATDRLVIEFPVLFNST
jgi:hypothetical protein